MDEGDNGVNFQLRRRLGLHGLLGTLLVPQPCEDARLDLLSHLHNLSFFLLFSLSRNRVLNLTVCAGASSECQRSTACTGGGLGVCWWGEQQGSLARSGALFYARGLVKCAGWTRRISPEKQGGPVAFRGIGGCQVVNPVGDGGAGLRRSQGWSPAYCLRREGRRGSGVSPACSCPPRTEEWGTWASIAEGTATVCGRRGRGRRGEGGRRVRLSTATRIRRAWHWSPSATVVRREGVMTGGDTGSVRERVRAGLLLSGVGSAQGNFIFPISL